MCIPHIKHSFNTMFSYITFLFVLPLLVHSDDFLVNGTCPKPTPEEKSKLDNIKGTWWLDQTDDVFIKDEEISCDQQRIQKNNDWYDISTSTTISKNVFSDKQRLIPVKGEPGRWTDLEYKKKQKEYKETGYVLTTIKILVEEKDKGMLNYMCKEKDDKHYGYYSIYLSEGNKNEKKFRKDLLAAHKEIEDSKPLFKVEHKDCKSKSE